MSPFVEARRVSVYITILRRFYAARSRNSPVGGAVDVALHEALCYNVTDLSLIHICALPPVRVELGTVSSVQPGIAGDGYVLLPRSDAANLSRSIDLPESVNAPVSAGDTLGTLTLSSGERELCRVTLTALSDVPRLGAGGLLSDMLRLLVCLPVSST